MVFSGHKSSRNDQFRSATTHDYVNLDDASGPAGTFYHTSHCASANLIWQLQQRLGVGLEGLYGIKPPQDSGKNWRV
jgi:hypothetical protein